jgi:archaeal flagellar protein FlaG
MAKEVIVTAILIISSVIAAVAFVNAIIPSVYDLSNSYGSLANSMGEQFKTDIDIVFIYPDPIGNNVSVWIKNVGSENIPLSKLRYCDFFVLSSSKYWNPGFESGSAPSWNYTLVNGNESDTWNRGETIKASIYFDSLPKNSYQITFFLYNGISASDEFSK